MNSKTPKEFPFQKTVSRRQYGSCALKIKIHPISVEIKEDGSVRVITDAYYPVFRDLEAEDDSVPASLNAYIYISQLLDYPKCNASLCL